MTKSKKSKKTTTTTTKKLKLSKQCAPFVDINKTITTNKIHSCLNRKALLKLVDIWNLENTENTIEYNKNSSNTTLWNNINARMISKCGNGKEFCWLEQSSIKNNLDNKDKEILDVFKPKMPLKWRENPREWLNTLDIQAVMNQYEKKYSDFEFIGPVPIDFDSKLRFGSCVVNELCNINLSKMASSGIKKIGIIFNLDKHNESGSHWIAMYCCLNRCGIYYWDSYGMEPPKEVLVLMKRLQTQATNKMNLPLEIKINDVRHQYKGSECGVYCLHFIIQLLNGKSFEWITKNNIIPDDQMVKYRSTIYNKLF